LARSYRLASILAACELCRHKGLLVVARFFISDPAPTEVYPLSLHDALPISGRPPGATVAAGGARHAQGALVARGRLRRGMRVPGSEEHTAEPPLLTQLVWRPLLGIKND